MHKRMLLVGAFLNSIIYPMAKNAMVATSTSNGPQPMHITVPGANNVTQNAPVILNVTNQIAQNDMRQDHSNHSLNQNQKNDQTANQSATQETNIQLIQQTYQSIKNILSDQITRGKDYLLGLYDWIRYHKIKLIGGVAITGYLTAVIQLSRMNFYLQDEALWSRWRYEDSYEQLCKLSQKEFAQDLVFAIQRRYTSEKQFTDFIQPLISFLTDLEQEKRTLRTYISIGKWIMRLRMNYLLPINQKKINLAKKLLQRVYFLEHIFLSWAAEFKIEHNQRI